ncbi:hypothetical protein SDC9_115151 [bioreactor metagenome]|uniref:HTH tetR-type domain-containing protein n=1 Tax=bioreactor metagenome TaxID=1076179 RepID=A0A645BS17_9ZZZZ|nr:TetR/AcrR family transcriptional regulator [Bacteroidaceae bacterium]MEA4973702.1 TetR/AcrR family transcriptional regulator [Candidatus Metalachnospira sp.]
MNSRDKVVQSAFDLFILNGVSNLSVNDMLKELKMTKGGFYYYFKSKDELICEIIDKNVLEILWRQFRLAASNSIADNSRLTIKEKLKTFYLIIPNPSIIDEKGQILRKYSIKSYYFMLYELIDKYPKLNEGYIKYYNENLKVLVQILNEGKMRGCIKKEVDAEKFAELIMAIRDGIFSIYMVNDEDCITEKLEASFEVIWKQLNQEVI